VAACDVLVIGAGIVGATCALALQGEGLQVGLVDAQAPGSGITAVGMGHLVALDECEAELDLCLLSLRLWQDFFDAHRNIGEPSHCGTLWVAENEDQLAEAYHRAERLNRRDWDAAPLTSEQLAQLEPALRKGLCGGVFVRGDSVVYPPAVAHYIASLVARQGGTLHIGQRVTEVGQGCVTLADGSKLSAKHIVVANGPHIAALLPGVPVFGRKGHLAITDRYPGRLKHQVVSMNYGQSAAGEDALAVAANVQPRPTGQWLIGSCRQDKQVDNTVDPQVLAKVMQSAIGLLPCLGDMQVIRAWAGMRPATTDGKPLIGPHPSRPGIWLAAGHEGLGVTTAFGTARLLADQLLGRALDPRITPFLPSRFEALCSGSGSIQDA
jgi:glycine/D-amino acid oxidase-like deaminating enzyme